MGEILILTSIDGRILTNQLIDSWFDTNEMFITNKNFSHDHFSVEITFIDDERAEMMLDFLSTCYSNYISISRPQTLISSLNDSYEEEREPSPVHLSSALSTSSRVTCFSHRLIQLDNKKNDDILKPGKGRGRVIQTNLSQIDMSNTKEIDNDKEDLITSSNTISPVPSIEDSIISSGYGRGRGAIFK